MKTVYDIQKIMGFLPHRYPFILVDRIIELVPGERVVGLKISRDTGYAGGADC